MSQQHLLIVHHDDSVRTLMTSMLQTLGHRIDEAQNDRMAVRLLEHSPADLILAAVEPSEPDALELLGYLRRKLPRVPVVLVFTETHPERNREALQRGAASVLRFPMTAIQLRAAVSQALLDSDSRGTNGTARPALGPAAPINGHSLPNPATNGHATNGHAANGHAANGHAAHAPSTNGQPAAIEAPGLVGEDPSLRLAIELASTIAPTRAPVLIVGERGTGKTLLARTLHDCGPDRDGPFVVVACAEKDDEALLEELFGRRGGAPGRFAAARGGTLVLDDVASLSHEVQDNLLRVLREGRFTPLGASQSVPADVRVVFETREDLAALVAEGAFRPDLYYRVSVVALKLPPLRHRGTDVVRLAEHFRTARAHGRTPEFSNEALDTLRGQAWPGNVAELKAIVERALIVCRGPRIEPPHLALLAHHDLPADRPATPRSRKPSSIRPLKEALEVPEKELILQALRALNWNRQETARVLDINRTTLYKKMKKYKILFDEPVGVH